MTKLVRWVCMLTTSLTALGASAAYQAVSAQVIREAGRVIKTSCLLLVGALFASPVLAAFDCNVTVRNVLIYRDGSVNVLHTGRNDYTVICNLRSEWGGTDPTTCSTWTVLLEHIKKKNGTAAFYFDGQGSCATMPTYWQSPAPLYIGDVTP